MRIAFINPQGNFDNKDSHLTEHPDFGGQLVYVKEVALALAKKGNQIDIFTRKINDKLWPEFFEPIINNYHGNSNVRIIRLPFGGEKFLNKEKLWPYLSKFADEIIEFYKRENVFPDAVTSHYGDGGITAAIIRKRTGILYTFTGHSLGAQKMDKLKLKEDNIEKFDKKFNFSKRIEAEREAMKYSDVNIVSTSQERMEQYSHRAYKGAVDVRDDRKFKVIPPGVNTDIFDFNEKDIDIETEDYVNKMLRRDIKEERRNFPAIVLSSRLDAKKNHISAVKAYAESNTLKEKSNLVIVLRGIENAFIDYSCVGTDEIKILDEIMEVIKKYDLKGMVSMFSIDSQPKLGSLYRILSKRRSVFCLTALYEPFGLAPIEAMYCGLPAVVTKNGGPKEITDGGKFGILVSPEDEDDIACGLSKAIDEFEKYKKLGIERVEDKYTWENTASMYLEAIERAVFNKDRDVDISIDEYFENGTNEHRLMENLKKLYL